MWGYVNIFEPELKVREAETFKAYYCGLCRRVGRLYGQAPRFFLSYDSVFMALLLNSLEEGEEIFESDRCIAHPMKKRIFLVEERVLDFVAHIMVMLAYLNCIDDIDDEKSIKGRLGKMLLSSGYKRADEQYSSLSHKIVESLRKLRVLEQEKSENIDKTAGCFGEIMRNISLEWSDSEILAHFFDYLGRWIFLMDAVEDYDEDRKSGKYNPLIYRGKGLKGTDFLLYHFAGEISKAMDLLDFKKNRNIIENVVFLGMNKKMEKVLEDNGLKTFVTEKDSLMSDQAQTNKGEF